MTLPLPGETLPLPRIRQLCLDAGLDDLWRKIEDDPPPRDFWMSVNATNATTLRDTLHPLIDDHVLFPYSSGSTDTWDVLNDADENPSDETRLLTIYRNNDYPDGCSGSCSWNLSRRRLALTDR